MSKVTKNVYLTERIAEMLKEICELKHENVSQLVQFLIMQEYHKLKLTNEDKP